MLQPLSSDIPQAPSLTGRADGHWRIELLGGLSAASGDVVLPRLPSRAVAMLLARLALCSKRSHGREELVELLWPDVALRVGRNRLRQALSTLRHLLEPPGSGSAVVIIADRNVLRFAPNTVVCDAVEFERAVRERRLVDARSLYRGELLPGFYDAWVLDERARLQALVDGLDGLDGERSAPSPATAERAAAIAAARTGAGESAAVRAPIYLSSFIGRGVEMQRCTELLVGNRLVTVTGSGGCGKTRLAAEVARTCTSFDEVVFAGLADCGQARQLADRVRGAARLAAGTTPALELLSARFAECRVLLVLDNFEQLVDDDGPQAVLELLERLPCAHVLVTSRRVLQLPGEQELVLLPFPVPSLDDDRAQAGRNAAVALFIDRARSVRGDFHLTAANLEPLLAVCRLLEGLPLALEIAASRVRTYGLHEMRSELQRGFAVVARSALSAAREPRHASLRATIDWSWRLLTPRLQTFLVSLTVFRGGCSATEAGAVTGDPDTHALLDALLGDSLLTSSADDSGEAARAPRFQMLESVREFVLEHMDADRSALLRQSHRAYFLGQAMAIAERHQPVADATLGNFIEALRTALEDGAYGFALALVLALKLQWESVGTPPDALRLMRRAAECAPPDTERLSTFLSLLSRLLLLGGQAEQALDVAARALATAGEDAAVRAEAMFACTRVDWVLNRDAPRLIGAAREGVRLAEAAGGREIQASALSLLGAVTLWGLNEPQNAEAIYHRAETLYLALGNQRGALQASHGRMGCLYTTGRHAEAISMGVVLDERAEELGNVEAQLVVLNLLEASYGKTHRFAEALSAAQRGTRIAHRHHKIYNLVHALWGQGRSLARLRSPEKAGLMMAFAARYWSGHLGPLPAAEVREMARVRRLVAAQLGAARCSAVWARGEGLPARDGIRLGCGD